jgi:protocatechuate 3,4-dioxygenase beta subunit
MNGADFSRIRQSYRTPSIEIIRPKRRRRFHPAVERLENRTVPDTTTFAQFQPLFPAVQAFTYTEDGNSASLQTIPGGDPVLVNFDNSLASGITSPLDAHFFLDPTTTIKVVPPSQPGLPAFEQFLTTSTEQITLDTPVNGKSNFLTVTFTGVFLGQLGQPEAAFQASDSSTPRYTVSFSSDFFDFSNSINHGFSIAFSSLKSNDGSGGLQIGADGFFKPFTASASGTFDTNFAPLGQIHGVKFDDLAGTGIRGQGDPGMAGITIQLINPANSQVLETTTTDVNGDFSFTDLASGTYRIREVELPGWIQTTPNPPDIVVTRGSDITDVTFGNHELPGEIQGFKFNDLNGDGILGANEPGMAGVTIDLENPSTGQVLFTTTTDSNGNFSFMNLPPGTYRIREVEVAGFTQTTQNPADITVTAGSDTTGIHFGNHQLPGEIHGFKFDDLNGDGILGANEPGMAGVTIDLENPSNGQILFTTTTDSKGNFSFMNLAPGTYRIREVEVTGFMQTTLNPPDIIVTAGSDTTGILFGNHQIPGEIHGLKFDDLNGDGIQESNESGMGGVTINLENPSTGQVLFTTTTNSNGNFSFTNLPPATYSIREVEVAGFRQTTLNPADITVAAGADITGITFGNQVIPGEIQGMKFEDVNATGIQEPNDPGMAGIIIELIDPATNMIITTQTTDANGDFSFMNLAPGTYRLREFPVAGFRQTTANPADITVAPGQDVTGITFGNALIPQVVTLPGEIQGVKFNDVNGNGVRDANEPGLPGFTIELFNTSTNQLVARTTSGADGSFSFTNLSLGTYNVAEVEQTGWVETNAASISVTVTSGADITGIMIGNQQVTSSIGGSNGGPTGTTPPTGVISPSSGGVPPVVSKLEFFNFDIAALTDPPPGTTTTDLQNLEAYVGGLYESLLGRAPDATGMANFTTLLLAGTSRQQVATMLWDSPEHRGLEVDQFYVTYLSRFPDPAGRAAWVTAFSNGATELTVEEAIVASPEYNALHSSNSDFLTSLYSQVLGRTSDTAGFTNWLQLMQNGLSRSAVTAAFLTSAEADLRLVDAYYVELLNRPADSAGASAWVDLMVTGRASFQSVGISFLASDEFFARFSGAAA